MYLYIADVDRTRHARGKALGLGHLLQHAGCRHQIRPRLLPGIHHVIGHVVEIWLLRTGGSNLQGMQRVHLGCVNPCMDCIFWSICSNAHADVPQLHCEFGM